MKVTVLIVIVCQVSIAVGQSVAQQCMREQVSRDPNNNNNNNNNNQQTPAFLTMAAFDAICSNYVDYINCFQTGLPNSNNPADRFLSLIFTPEAMDTAYRGLCTLDLEELRPNIRCVLNSQEVRRCYNDFNRNMNQVILFQNNQAPLGVLQPLACNVSVDRYRCETAAYGNCNAQVGQIMRDFFFAGLSDECRQATGVTSRYVELFNNADISKISQGTIILMLSFIFFLSIISLG